MWSLHFPFATQHAPVDKFSMGCSQQIQRSLRCDAFAVCHASPILRQLFCHCCLIFCRATSVEGNVRNFPGQQVRSQQVSCIPGVRPKLQGINIHDFKRMSKTFWGSAVREAVKPADGVGSSDTFSVWYDTPFSFCFRSTARGRGREMEVIMTKCLPGSLKHQATASASLNRNPKTQWVCAKFHCLG